MDIISMAQQAKPKVIGQIADLRGLSPEEVGARTARNFREFFSLPENNGAI